MPLAVFNKALILSLWCSVTRVEGIHFFRKTLCFLYGTVHSVQMKLHNSRSRTFAVAPQEGLLFSTWKVSHERAQRCQSSAQKNWFPVQNPWKNSLFSHVFPYIDCRRAGSGTISRQWMHRSSPLTDFLTCCLTSIAHPWRKHRRKEVAWLRDFYLSLLLANHQKDPDHKPKIKNLCKLRSSGGLFLFIIYFIFSKHRHGLLSSGTV